MLTNLHIKNIALISELNLEFSKGLNILSGETGAGKSIIIDSLNFVLGDRADKGLIRHGQTTASVQAVFCASNAELDGLLAENGIPLEENIIVRRTMSENGRSECRINGIIVSLSSLKRMVSLLVDIHSQHENQALLNEANHIKILDNYSKNLPKIKVLYRNSYLKYKQAAEELAGLPSKEECLRQIDILEFQLAEIAKADIKADEEDQLVKERSKLYNSQKLINSLSTTLSLLEGDSGFGAIPSVHSAAKELNSVSNYDEAYALLADRLDSVKIEVSDIISSIKDEIENSTFDAAKMEAIEKRIDDIRKIKRRFGSTLEDIQIYKDKAEAQLKQLLGAAQREEELLGIISAEKAAAIRLAKDLHGIRTADAAVLEKAIVANLSDLGMQDSIFKASINFPDAASVAEYLNTDGADEVRFLISPNKGEPLKPLAKIASGGEMSRLMLGLKNITAELENIDTLVFDEIDTGISGRIAKVVACKLYNIAKTRQVLAVTHLPQLASMADTHYLISKRVIEDKTLTFVEALCQDASIKEIMRLSGSIEQSQSGLENAKEMKDWANKYKHTLIT